MKALIFGANGQDGFYLSELLALQKIQVMGISRSGNFLHTDIADPTAINELIKINKPEFIFHLAANSTTRHDALFENHQTISTGTLNILEAVKNFSPDTKVFISGSALQFKNIGKPINETTAFEANDAYSVSRIHSVYAARYYRSIGIKTYVGYFFNHDSPLRTERHISQKIVAALKRISKGSEEKIILGDVKAGKEWGFAGDITKAVWALVNQDQIFEAVIGTGKAYTIEYWLKICFESKGLNWQDYFVQDKSYQSPYQVLVSDPSLMMSLGWAPDVSIEQLAQMMINQ
ncbi:MAG: GDP-mannose 4,6-dehydratase [Bacteroidetes bacterium]|nr:GDP-mannose 4,6-dehydratase [Bacteroidota bacterium]MBS1756521.1 GDP-mannose 4,6-dehydratase [Bacteroidota bacterium]